MKKSILLSLVCLSLLAARVHAQGPTITSVSPTQASPAVNIVQVTINGFNLAGATDASFQFNNSGISVSNTVAATDGSLVVTNFNVCGAVPGPYSFTITTANGTSNSAGFNVTQSGPVIGDTQPRAAAAGTSFQIAILGCALQNIQAIFAQTTGVSFSNINSNGTQVTANMNIAPSTPGGQFALSVANSIGTSNSIFFDVIAGGSAPSLSSLSPASEPPGTTFNLTLNGSNLSNASAVTFTPSSGIGATITQDSSSQITAVVSIDAFATPGNYIVVATTPAGNSNGLIFTVASSGSSGPTINSLSPSSVAVGSSAFTLTVNGSGFLSGATVQINGSNRTTSFLSSGQVTAKILASDVSTAGNKSINVTNPSGGNGGGPVSNTATLKVQ